MADQLEKKTEVAATDIDKLLAVFAELNTTDVWNRVGKDDFNVKRFPMGFVNDIACCELTPEAQKRLCKSPLDSTGIVVKFVPKELFIKIPRLEFVACNTLLSEGGITPRLTFIDDKCMINEYVGESRNYNQEDDIEEETVQELARVLARVHSLRPPISMSGYKMMDDMFASWDNPEEVDMPGMEDLINKKYLDHIEADPDSGVKDKFYATLKEIDFKNLNKKTRELSKKVNSPLVFSHNDFNRGNRLVQVNPNSKDSKKKSIYLVDFDYSAFNHRGYDLGRYFSNYRHEDDMFGDEGFPTDEEMALFIEEYRQECARIQGDHYLESEENSLKKLTLEAKIFTLLAYGDYFFCLMMYTFNPTGPKKDYFLQSAFNRYNALKKQLQLFTEDGTIPSVLNNSTNGHVEL